MGIRTIRRTSVSLPSLDEPGVYLSQVASLEGGRGRVADFHYGDAELRALDLADTHLIDGRITRLTVRRARLEQLRVDSVEFVGCELSSLHWAGGRASRAVFRDCKLLGAALEDIALDNVLFEECKLDYGTFDRVRAVGAVIFSRCSLREAVFRAPELGPAVFDGCDLRLAEFGGGAYRGMDLRGNDLSGLRGVASLRQVVIERAQTMQLAEALAAELDVTYGEDG
jgi:uncharacterized protein YjbI with pentapeptide repeats